MAGITQTYVIQIKDDALRTVASETHAVTGDTEDEFSVSCPGSAGTVSVPLSVDVSAVVAFWVVSDKDVSMTENDDGTPDLTVALAAGVPYWWYTGFGANPFTVDMAGANALKFTNAGVPAATIKGGFLLT